MQPISTRALARGRAFRWTAVTILAVISVSVQLVAAAIGSAPALAAGLQARGPQLPTGGLAQVEVPVGAHQCPNSGSGASCSYEPPMIPGPGAASLPVGLLACASDPSKPTFRAPGACSDEAAGPSTAASGTRTSSTPQPSLTVTTIEAVQQTQSIPQIELSADKSMLAAGGRVLLSVSTTATVTGTPWAIEVFDETTQALVGACAVDRNCQVAFAAGSGAHVFVAYVAVPSSAPPVSGIHLESTRLTVHWLGVTLAASDPSVVGPGRPVIFTATASDELSAIGYRIEISDIATGQWLTYCSQGTTCRTSLVEPVAGTHTIVAKLILASLSVGTQLTQEKSAQVTATWLGIVLTASAYSLQGGTTGISANTNSNLANSPWAIFIYESPAQMISGPCVAATCAATLTLPAGGTPSFFAVVARKDPLIQGSRSPWLVLGQADAMVPDIQVRSAVVTPVRMMWGVDSCAAFTQDASGSTGLLPQVAARLGAPDFWARYLPTTGNCAGLSSTEVAVARSRHMAILPIYNDYDCSAVIGSSAGAAYAAGAVQIAIADQIPPGTAIAIDIEPPGDACPGAAGVDVGFITGWFDGISGAGYVPVYYGNSTAGSEFGQAWCAAVALRPEIASGSFLWSFEPDLLGGFTKSTAPVFAPYYSGCGGQYDAWQYRISDGSTPDVDHDEATNQLPMWYP